MQMLVISKSLPTTIAKINHIENIKANLEQTYTQIKF
jgi:hypothetical protein